jgi:hypothetical protein
MYSYKPWQSTQSDIRMILSYVLAGVICSSAWTSAAASQVSPLQSGQGQSQEQKSAVPTSASTQSEMKFEAVSICEFFDTVDGSLRGCSSYRASNEEGILVYSRTFGSTSELADYVAKKLKTAKNIIERGQRKDEKGEKVGERILATLVLKYLTEPAPKTCTVLIWTRGNTYTEFSDNISNDSVKTVLAFEKFFEKTK